MKSILIAVLAFVAILFSGVAFGKEEVVFSRPNGRLVFVTPGESVGLIVQDGVGRTRYPLQDTRLVGQQGNRVFIACSRRTQMPGSKARIYVYDTIAVPMSAVRVVKQYNDEYGHYSSGSGGDYSELWKIVAYILFPPYFIADQLAQAASGIGDMLHGDFPKIRYRVGSASPESNRSADEVR